MKRQGRGCDSGCKQKNNEKTIKSSLSGTKALLVFFALLQQRVSAENAFSCDVYADSCPDQWKFDGQCDEDQLQCRGGDCFDCDKCQQFHYDCNSCIENGCYWCPGDALCFNSPHYVSVGAFSSCPNADDYTQSTCTEPDNFFRYVKKYLISKKGDVNFQSNCHIFILLYVKYSDPMYSGQKWVFEMIHVVPVWEQGILGTGVRVRINDSGVQSEHPDFDNRFDKLGSCNLYEIDPFDFQMDPGFAAHGTFVAGIVGGGANNNECGVGIAPEVTLSACYAFGDESQVLEEKLDWFDVSQNSWGTDGCSDQNLQRDRKLLEECPFEYSIRVCDVCDFSQQITSQCENAIVSHCSEFFEEDEKACSDFIDLIVGGRCQFNVLSETDRQGLLNGITDGRDGKGIIYVFASGNAFGTGDDTNFQGFTNTRFVISVGAVGKDAIHASYSTPGASIFISAPGGDNGNDSNIITTTLEGGCIDATIGTSFACPVVSGVIALVLESNPDLTWRDVQGILAISSQSVEDQGDDTATTNAAGFWHSNLYGFGVVDAKSAVNVAKSWELYEREQMLVGESGILDIPLSDDPLMPLKSSISFSLDQDNFIAESVAVFLDVTHFSRGHLEIVLTSPQGTKSVLQPGKRPENTQLEEGERWKLLTVRNWGESPEGDWELSVADLKEGDVSQCADRPWALLLDDFDASCLSLEQFRICENGQLDPFDQLTNLEYDFVFSFVDNGFKAAEACCACGGGIGGNEVQDTFKQWMIVVYGRYSGDQPPIWAPVLVPTVDYSCNILNDKCPSKLDGICDSLLGDDPKTGCEYGDCVDCNFCSNFDFDCEGCAGAKGCYYCPGDATCYNSPLYSIGSCTKDTDYIGDVGTCANSSLIFKYVSVLVSCFLNSL